MSQAQSGLGTVMTDRRGKRGGDRRKRAIPVAQDRRQGERRQQGERRRQIDPTTCERDYNDEEIVFMQALDAYKRASGRMFPTCSEILEVIRSLGYVRLPQNEAALPPAIECEPVEPSESL